jgi:hypothetical protein
MNMSIQPNITVVLANRPRLFRELLQHALNTASSRFRVVEATDALSSSSSSRDEVLRDATWLIVDEETATDAEKLAPTYPNLSILALDGRGSRARVLAGTEHGGQQSLSEVPTLSTLFDLLSQDTRFAEQSRNPRLQ